jgi:manganese oxidase
VRIAPLLAALLLLAACAGPAASPSPSAGPAIAVALADFMITPTTVTATSGSVTIDVTSHGPTVHNMTIRDAAGQHVANSVDLHAGESDEVTATLAPGQYTIFCSFAGHESLGMHASLAVTAP